MTTVEFFVMWDDNTWGLYRTKVPEDCDTRDNMVRYMEEVEARDNPRFKRAVGFQVYHIES